MAKLADAIPQVRIHELTLSEMVRLFNTMTKIVNDDAVKPVSKFSTLTDGKRRCAKLLKRAYPGTSVGEDFLATLPKGVTFQHDLLEFQNGVVMETDTSYTGDGPLPAGENPGETPLDEAVAKAAKKAKKAKAPKAPKAPKPETENRGRRGNYIGDEVITLLKEGNARRPGTGAHQRYSLYRTGMTIDDYVKAGGFTSNIATDVKRGNISIAAPDGGDEPAVQTDAA